MSVKILFTIPNVVTAGSGRALFEIARRLDRSRFEPSLCVAQGGGALLGEFRAAGIPVLERPFTVPAKPYGGLPLRAWRAARAFPRFDLWHSFHYLDDYTEPLIARLSGAGAWVYTKKNMSWHARSWTLRTRLADAVAVQNRDMMESFFARPASFRRKARFVPRGVDTERFRPVNPPPEVRGDGPLVVGCVAQLVRVKGHRTLLEALARVPGLRLRLAGKALDDELAAELRELSRSLGLEERVEWTGQVGDVPGFLAGLDVFVLPTWARWRMEGCPVALLEAMACGLPVIATDIPGSRDVVRDGVDGLLVPPEDAPALARALESLRHPERRLDLGRAARRRVLESYTIEREAADHERLYGELVG